MGPASSLVHMPFESMSPISVFIGTSLTAQRSTYNTTSTDSSHEISVRFELEFGALHFSSPALPGYDKSLNSASLKYIKLDYSTTKNGGKPYEPNRV